MEAARKAVEEFLAKAGHHDTTVHERVAPAVTHQTITRIEHEDVTTAIDREIHQDHYHISLQPIDDEETVGEQHTFNLTSVEHRTLDHDEDRADVQRRLNEEAAKFVDEVIRVDGKKTSTIAPLIAGEHIHHHVHETIQPIINKRVIEPYIIHTTHPIHEVHHMAATHHATSSLPAVSLAEYKKNGGFFVGREERYDFFEGEPRSKVLGSLSKQQSAQGPASPQPTSQQPSSPSSTGAKGSDAGQTSNHNAAPVAAPDNNTSSAAPAPAAANPSPMKDAGTQTTSSPQAPPIPPRPTPSALSMAMTRLHSAPTYISPHHYLRAHPAGITGARPVPQSTPVVQSSDAKEGEKDRQL